MFSAEPTPNPLVGRAPNGGSGSKLPARRLIVKPLRAAQRVELGEGYQVRFSEQVRAEAQIPTMAVGMIYDPRHAESLVAEGKADLVALARGLLFDPHWALRAATALGAEITAPPQYERSYGFPFLQEKERNWMAD